MTVVVKSVGKGNYFRQCRHCGVWFQTDYDEGRHFPNCKGLNKLGWRNYNNTDEWCLSEKDPQLKRAIQQQGRIQVAGWAYSLSTDSKYLKRRRAAGGDM